MEAYYDKKGQEISDNSILRMEDGTLEHVYRCQDQEGEEDLGINASNEAYLRNHPDAEREYYSLSNFDLSQCEVITF